jgi:NADP-dependent 3-hydroxy acid dehydrogenase YdfG
VKNLTNKVAVVTGGNSGMGYATAKELVEEGVKMIVTGRNKAAIKKAANELGITGIVSDQSKLAQIEKGNRWGCSQQRIQPVLMPVFFLVTLTI